MAFSNFMYQTDGLNLMHADKCQHFFLEMVLRCPWLVRNSLCIIINTSI